MMLKKYIVFHEVSIIEFCKISHHQVFPAKNRTEGKITQILNWEFLAWLVFVSHLVLVRIDPFRASLVRGSRRDTGLIPGSKTHAAHWPGEINTAISSHMRRGNSGPIRVVSRVRFPRLGTSGKKSSTFARESRYQHTSVTRSPPSPGVYSTRLSLPRWMVSHVFFCPWFLGWQGKSPSWFASPGCYFPNNQIDRKSVV